jgi:hypothetical protein
MDGDDGDNDNVVDDDDIDEDDEMEISSLAEIVVRPHLGPRCDSPRSAPDVSLTVP